MRGYNEPRRRHAEFWNAFNRLILFGIAIVLIATIALWFYPELQKRNEMAAKLSEQQKQLRSEELLRKQREREVHLLETNKEYLEVIARDKLDLMKDGETIFRPDAPPPGSTKTE